MRVVKILAISAAGSLACFGLACVYTLIFPYFHWWTRLSVSSDDLPNYLSERYGDGVLHSERVTRPCDYSKPEFSAIAFAPSSIVDCLQLEELYPDAIGRTTYVLDKNHQVWMWTYIQGSLFNVELLFWSPFVGLGVGVIIAFVRLCHRAGEIGVADSCRIAACPH